jgi:hypothetical protein
MASRDAASFCCPVSLSCGLTAPHTPHSVVLSLPTLRDLIGYEEAAWPHPPSAGYPRFVESSLLGRVQRELSLRLQGLPGAPQGASVFLVKCQSFGLGMLAWVGSRAPLTQHSAVVPGEGLVEALEAPLHSSSGGWAGLVSSSGGRQWADLQDRPTANHCSSAPAAAVGKWAAVVCCPAGGERSEGAQEEPPQQTICSAANTYQQHIGCRLGSREAELLGVRLGLWEASHCVTHGEDGIAGDSEAEALLLGLVEGAFKVPPAALTANGMAAFAAVYAAVQLLQASAAAAPGCPHPHRDTWLMVGSLYLDTACMLQKFPATPSAPPPLLVPCATDAAAIEAALGAWGARLAGVVTECPTNPLLQTVDLEVLQGLVRRLAPGAVLVVDPTIAGLGSVNPLPLCDAVVCSLTKHVGASGDVMGGVVAVNPGSPHAAALRACGLVGGGSGAPPSAALGLNTSVGALCCPYLPLGCPPPPLGGRDMRRLASSARQWLSALPSVCATAARLHGALVELCRAGGRGLSAVHWAGQGGNLRALAGGGVSGAGAAGAEEVGGSMLTLELEGTFPGGAGSGWSHDSSQRRLEKFYDALQCVKGPSFGLAFTVACPFMYLVSGVPPLEFSGRARMWRLGSPLSLAFF